MGIFGRHRVKPKPTSWGQEGIYAELVSADLKPGKYLLKVRLLGAPPPAGVKLSTRVVVPYRGK